MDDVTKKEALRLFTYGLYAVTTGDATRWNAFTANWLSQVSFEPPLVAVSVENASVSLPIIRATGHFAVNVLTAEQRELAGTLGKSLAKHPGKLEGLTRGTGEAGCPVLLEAAARVEGQAEGELAAGGATLVPGAVGGGRVQEPAGPPRMPAAGV